MQRAWADVGGPGQPRGTLQTIVERTDDDHFSAVVDLEAGPPIDKKAGYDIRASADVGGEATSRWAQTAPACLDAAPLRGRAGHHAVTVHRSRGTCGFASVSHSSPTNAVDWPSIDSKSTFTRPADLVDAVVFESFAGKNIADSPKAICGELLRRDTGLELFWTVDDLTRPVPQGTTPLLLYSRRWMETLHRARYLVNNNNFPFYFRKQPEQVYLQTWHGTPLKKIGNDVPLTNLSLPYRSLMTREPGYWNYLLAQNPFAAQTLPTSFGYEGDVIDLGYPRNDSLVTSPPEVRDDVRRRLGVAPGTTAILYAPTWRPIRSRPSRGTRSCATWTPRPFGQRSGRGHGPVARARRTRSTTGPGTRPG